MRLRLGVAALVGALALACGSDGVVGVETHNDYIQARARWESIGLSSYSVEMKLSCFCAAPFTSWHELRIENNRVVSAKLLEGAAGLSPAPVSAFPTVTVLFERFDAEVRHPNGFAEGTFDATTGLPVSVTLGTLANDAGVRYELRRLH